jgi:pimeloyl-ACP methyl ester carboxylesterase
MPEFGILGSDQAIRLTDGRRLSFAEYGVPDGKPILLFHGIPGSRLLRHPDDGIAKGLGVRLIVPDRPGMGGSDPQPGRTFLDWPADVLALAEALGLGRFAVVGISGGAPYAAACGARLAARLTAVGIFSGVGPLDAPGAMKGMLPTNRMGYRVARRMPWAVWRRVFGLYYGGVREHPEKLARATRREPEADRRMLAQPGVREMLTEMFEEAFRQGTEGPAWEGWLLARPWGFSLAEVGAPVYLWQGEADVVVTAAMGRYMAGEIPHCEGRFLEGEGHLLWLARWEEVLAVVALGGCGGSTNGERISE